jgi:hypothetical protein
MTETNEHQNDRVMRRNGYPAMAIHGDKQQRERDWVLVSTEIQSL